MFDEYIHEKKCEKLPGTLVQINIPAGATINLANLLEVTSPSGICLIVRSPLISNNDNFNIAGIMESLKKAGITVETEAM